MSGTLVLACRSSSGLTWESGGFDDESAAEMARLLPEYGAEVVRVFDGPAEAREKFPPGTRVIASRKYWGSPLGVVVDGGYSVNGQGPVLLTEFDGHVSVWNARSLEAVTPGKEVGRG
jgi:hypothetical protein